MLRSIHRLVSIIVSVAILFQASAGIVMAAAPQKTTPTWEGRLPSWANDPAYEINSRGNDLANAAPQLKNASPGTQFQALSQQLPPEVWGILADTLEIKPPPYQSDDFPLPPTTPPQDIIAAPYTVFLPMVMQPTAPVWGTKPILNVTVPETGVLAQELNFTTAETVVVDQVIATEQAAIAVLDAEADPIIQDETLTLEQKRAAIVAMDYNGRLQDILDNSNQQLQANLDTTAYNSLVAYAEAQFEQMRQQTAQMRAADTKTRMTLATTAADNECYSTTVWGTTSTYNDFSVDLPDKELKFANRGWSNGETGYENPPYTVNLDYNGAIVSSVIITDIIENTNDNYWRENTDPVQPRRWGTDLPLGTPQAEAAYFNNHNGGMNEFGIPVSSPAGVSLSQPVAAQLGVSYPYTISVTYDWDCDVTNVGRFNRTFGLNSFSAYAAQGVNPVTGNQFQWFRDFIVPGRGLNVDFVRYYNAQLNEEGMFGLGWSTIYDMYAKPYPSGVIEIRYADGHKGLFTPDGNGGYGAEPGVFETLIDIGTGYQLTTNDQISFNFDGNGRLQTIQDTNNNQITLNYTGTNVSSIVDTSGRSFALTYDGFGHVTHVNAPDSRTYTYTYGTTSLTNSLNSLNGLNSGGNQLLQMTNAGGNSTNFEYDPSGNWMTKVSDPTGVDYLNNVYTPDGRVQSQSNGKGGESTFDYDLDNLTATETDANGNKTIYYFDSEYRVIKEEDALGNSITYTYDGDNIASMTDKRGNNWYYTYDERGNMLSQEDPVDDYSALYYTTDITYYEYDADNNMIKMTDALGNITEYEYDAKNNPIKITEDNDAITIAEYNGDGELTMLKDAEGRVTEYEYDGDGNLIKTIDAYLNETTSTYDPNGNQLSQTDAQGRTTHYEYDKNDNLIKMIDAMGKETVFEYDENNWMKKKIDRRGGVWEWEYDDNGNPTLERDPEGNVVTHTYDDMSNRLSTTNARKHTTTFEHDVLYRLIKVTDAKLNETEYSYDANGNLLAITDPNEETTRFTYDSANRRKYVYDALGGVTEYCYDPLDRIIRMFDPRRAKTDFFYDNVGNLYEVHDPLAHVTSFDYDLVHNRIAVTDANDNTTEYTFDKLNREIEVTNALSHTMYTGYDKVGNTTVITDAMDFVTTYIYNDNNWLESTTNPMNDQAFFGYDEEGNRTSFTDENDHTTQYTYNLVGQVTDITDPLSGVAHYEYDENYNVITMRNALIKETTYQYDELDLLVWEKDPLQHQTSYEYDAVRRMISVTDAEQNNTQYGYDALGRLTSVTDAMSQVTNYEYDAVGNLTLIIDANGKETQFEYNFLNQLKRELNALGDTWQYGYNPVGNMALRVDGEWQATSYTYDAVNQLTRVIYGSTGQQVDYTYDANGNELSMTDWNGTFRYTYDELNRRKSATDHNDRVLEYDYDPVGNRTEMVYPDNRAMTMQYDANNRLETLTDPQNRDITWDYNALGYITEQTNPNGTATSYDYDEANRLTNLKNDGPTSVIAHYDYQMDDVGNRTQIIEERDGWLQPITRDYTYDELYRLTHVETSNGADTHYEFDPIGNRLEKSGIPETAVGITNTLPITVNYGYNDLNSMLYAGNTDFGYDLNGSRTHKSEPITATEYITVAASMGIYTATLETDYSYNYENRLVDVTTYISATDGTTLTLPVMQANYDYDGYGRRISKLVTTTITATQVLTTPEVLTRDYVFDGLDPVAEYEETQGIDTQEAEAFYYRANSRIALQERTENNNATDSYWYHADGLTTVVALSDESGAIQYESQYDEYGNVLTGETISINRYTYTGQEIDTETGFYHFFSRQYDPVNGIWLSQDIYRGELKLPISQMKYSYVQQNPILYVDVQGYKPLNRHFISIEINDKSADANVTLWEIKIRQQGLTGFYREDSVSVSSNYSLISETANMEKKKSVEVFPSSSVSGDGKYELKNKMTYNVKDKSGNMREQASLNSGMSANMEDLSVAQSLELEKKIGSGGISSKVETGMDPESRERVLKTAKAVAVVAVVVVAAVVVIKAAPIIIVAAATIGTAIGTMVTIGNALKFL